MRLHRFFTEEQLRNKKEVTIRDDDVIHQLKDVFRLHSGDRLVLLDNSGLEFLAEIVSLAKNGAELKIVESTAAINIPKRDIWLFVSLIKKDNFEWIAEKATEIGVSHFVPVISDRTEKKDLNLERIEKIIKEASEQSGRGTLPSLHEVVPFETVFDIATEHHIQLMGLHPEGDAFTADQNTGQSQAAKNLGIPNADEKHGPIGVLVGPEGGWSDREIALCKSHELPVYSLGRQVLRAETAAIAVSALLLLS